MEQPTNVDGDTPVAGPPNAAPAPAKLAPWLLVGIAFYLLGAMAVGSHLISSLLAGGDGTASGEQAATLDLVEVLMPVQGGVQLGILLITAWIVLRVGRHRIGIPWWGDAGPGFWVLGAYAVMMLVWVPIAFVVYPAVLGAMGLSIEPQPHLLFFTEPSWDTRFWIVLATVCVIGPISEEVVFRGFLQTGLSGAMGQRTSLLLVSAIFGLIHGLDKAFPLALMGLFFGILRNRDRGLGAPILAHILHNTTTVILTINMPDVLKEAFGQ